MRQLLMLAKGQALREGSSKLDLEHIRKICGYLTFINPEVAYGVHWALGLDEETPANAPHADVGILLSTASQAGPLPLTDEVKAFLAEMGGVDRVITAPYANQASALEAAGATLALSEIAQLKDRLRRDVFGQDAAIEALCDAFSRNLYQPKDKGPAGLFLFVGPPATGKTYLAELLAEKLGGDWTSKTINMASLVNESQSASLDGDEPSYQNARPGELTTHVRQHPRTVVVFDDIDKAHPNIVGRLVTLLNTGSMRDRFGFYPENDPKSKPLDSPVVDFRQTLIIFTTHAGESAYDDPGITRLIERDPAQTESVLLHELGQIKATVGSDNSRPQFPPTILAHWATGTTVLFRRLGLNDLANLAMRAFETVRPTFEKQFKCDLAVEQPDLLFKALVMGQAPDVDARKVSQDTLQRLLDPVTDHALENLSGHAAESNSDNTPANSQQNGAPSKLTSASDSPVQSDTKATPKPAGVWSRVNWRLADEDAIRLQAILADFGAKEPVAEMLRKGQTLGFDIRLAHQDAALTVELQNLSLRRVPHAQDFRGKGAVRVEVPEISFSQIAGHSLVKQRLQEIVRLLKSPERIRQFGIGAPKGVLLYGPPGTGKTMLAKALAHEADLPFLATTGSELLNLEFVKTLFQRARKYAPSLLFIDEIDALGRRDQAGYDVIINQLLTEIDGFDTSLAPPVFIIAATNLKEKLDPALIRAGRIDLHVEVPQLDRAARAYFIDRYLQLPHDGSLDRDTLLNFTSGMSGAALEQARREVVLEMVRHGQDNITQAMLLEQINRQQYGVRSSVRHSAQSREMTAYHEAGHAVVSMALNPDIRIEQVTITPRENASGFVSFDQEQDTHRRMTRREFMDDICVLLAGRLAEQKKFGANGLSAGASSDLANASHHAHAAITQYGLDEEFGLMSLARLDEETRKAASSLALDRVRAWLTEAEGCCESTLTAHWDAVEKIVAQLQADEVLDGETVRALFKD
jgi:cell division protease FtsH